MNKTSENKINFHWYIPIICTLCNSELNSCFKTIIVNTITTISLNSLKLIFAI